MPGKKKAKGGKKKGKKGGGDGKLPPPPNLDQTRQGALEALLKFRIDGREETIELVEQETETYKDKNESLKEKNHYLSIQKAEHYKTLVKQAREQEEVVERSTPKAEKEQVDKALTEKLRLAHELKEEVLECEKEISDIDEELSFRSGELAAWTNFKDVVQNENAARIDCIKERLKNMEGEAASLKEEYDKKEIELRAAIERRTAMLYEKEKEWVSERFLMTMDESTKGELSDNAWLKQEISIAKHSVEKLTQEVNALEHRNLKAIEGITSEQTADIQNTRDIYLATTRKSLSHTSEGLKQAGDGSGLPSLVNVAQCTSEQGPGGQAGAFEMKLLSLHGCKAPVIPPPDVFHLPPLEQQRTSQKTIPTKTLWPVSNTMLKSLAN